MKTVQEIDKMEMVSIRVDIPAQFNEALDLMVLKGGGEFSKATHVRLALSELLVQFGLLYPDVAEALVKPSKQTGRLASQKKRQEKN